MATTERTAPLAVAPGGRRAFTISWRPSSFPGGTTDDVGSNFTAAIIRARRQRLLGRNRNARLRQRRRGEHTVETEIAKAVERLVNAGIIGARIQESPRR